MALLRMRLKRLRGANIDLCLSRRYGQTFISRLNAIDFGGESNVPVAKHSKSVTCGGPPRVGSSALGSWATVLAPRRARAKGQSCGTPRSAARSGREAGSLRGALAHCRPFRLRVAAAPSVRPGFRSHDGREPEAASMATSWTIPTDFTRLLLLFPSRCLLILPPSSPHLQETMAARCVFEAEILHVCWASAFRGELLC